MMLQDYKVILLYLVLSLDTRLLQNDRSRRQELANVFHFSWRQFIIASLPHIQLYLGNKNHYQRPQHQITYAKNVNSIVKQS